MFFINCHSNPFKNIISGSGSVIQFGPSCDDISKERSSSLKLWVAASDMIRFCIYLGRFGLSLEFRVSPSRGSVLKCHSLWLLRKYSRDLNAVTCRTFDQWEYKIALSCGLEELSFDKNIGTHQIEKFVKFFSFIYLQRIYVEIADYRGIFIFLLECVNYGWHFLDKCFDIGIIIVIVRWSVNVADCNRPVKIVIRDSNK